MSAKVFQNQKKQKKQKKTHPNPPDLLHPMGLFFFVFFGFLEVFATFGGKQENQKKTKKQKKQKKNKKTHPNPPDLLHPMGLFFLVFSRFLLLLVESLKKTKKYMYYII